MAEYKNNHIIPKCLIRQWSTQHNNLNGVHTYEGDIQREYFSSDGGKKAFSFAIEKYFYVPKFKDQRIYQLEKWLSDVEGTFSVFIKALLKGVTGPILKTPEEYHKLLLGVFSMNTRTKYDIESIKKFMLENPDIKKMVEMEEERDIEFAALENMINVTTELALEYNQCRIVVCKNESGDLILGDRPFLHKAVDGYSFLPLHPNFFISIIKAPGQDYTYLDNTDDKMIHLLNQKIAENSHHWIIAKDPTLLKEYIPSFHLPKNYVTPYFQPVQYLRHGYKLT